MKLKHILFALAVVVTCGCGSGVGTSSVDDVARDGAASPLDVAPADGSTDDAAAAPIPTVCGIANWTEASVRCAGFAANIAWSWLAYGDATGLVLVGSGQGARWTAQRIDDTGHVLGAPFVGAESRSVVAVTRCGADLCVVESQTAATGNDYPYTRLTVDAVAGPGAPLVGASSPGPSGPLNGGFMLASDADPPVGLLVTQYPTTTALCRYGDSPECTPVTLDVSCGANAELTPIAVATFGGTDYVAGACQQCGISCVNFAGFLAPAPPDSAALSSPPSAWPAVAPSMLLTTSDGLWTAGETYPNGTTDDGPWTQGISVRRFTSTGAEPMAWSGPLEVTTYGARFQAAATDHGLLVLRARTTDSAERAHVTATFITNAGLEASSEWSRLAYGDATGLVLVSAALDGAWSAQRVDERGVPIGATFDGGYADWIPAVTRCSTDLCVVLRQVSASGNDYPYTRLTVDPGAGPGAPLIGTAFPGPPGPKFGWMALAPDADPPVGLRVDTNPTVTELCRYGDAGGCAPVTLDVTCAAQQELSPSALATFQGTQYVAGTCSMCGIYCLSFSGFLTPAAPDAAALSSPPSEWATVEASTLLPTTDGLWIVGEAYPSGTTDDGTWTQGLAVRRFTSKGTAPFTWAGPIEETTQGARFRAAANDEVLLVIRARTTNTDDRVRARVTATVITNAGVVTETVIRGGLDDGELSAAPIGVAVVPGGFVAGLWFTDGSVTLLRFDSAGKAMAW